MKSPQVFIFATCIFLIFTLFIFMKTNVMLCTTEMLIQILKIRSLLNFKIIKLRLFFIRKRLYY